MLTATIISLHPIQSVSQSRIDDIHSLLLTHYIKKFNIEDHDTVANYVSNSKSLEWLSANIPLFDCPDPKLQEIYYYRWWAFRKHLKLTKSGFIFTEFIIPVNHAGIYNSISSALGHQSNEARWLKNSQYIKDYISFWFFTDPLQSKPVFHKFSSWADDAVYQLYLVNQDKSFLQKMLPALNTDYEQWEKERKTENQLFWQTDVSDAMEESISGGRRVKNVRPTINSYMYGNAVALTNISKVLKDKDLEKKYSTKAAELRKLIHSYLWNDTASFFEARLENGKFAGVKEELGFIPWYFNLPYQDKKYAEQWSQLTHPKGFNAPWGITTAEIRHPLFRTHGTGECEWDGAVWPFATTQTLKGLANLLVNYKHHGTMNKDIFYNELLKYAKSHQMNGKNYVGEYLDGFTGEWLKGDNPRSRFYNHSGFADLIISDLIGLKPRNDNKLEIVPLIPDNKWDWFCLDKVYYHGKTLTIIWDKDGKKYGMGKGFQVYADGKKIAGKTQLSSLITTLK